VPLTRVITFALRAARCEAACFSDADPWATPVLETSYILIATSSRPPLNSGSVFFAEFAEVLRLAERPRTASLAL